jgi:hypothetical protein
MATLSYLTTTYFDFGALKRLPKALAGLGIKRPRPVLRLGDEALDETR